MTHNTPSFRYGIINLADPHGLNITNYLSQKASSNQNNANRLVIIEQSELNAKYLKTIDMLYVLIPSTQALTQLFKQLEILCCASVVFIMVSDGINTIPLIKSTPRNATIYPISGDIYCTETNLLDVAYTHFKALMTALEGDFLRLDFYDVIYSQKNTKVGYIKTINACSLDSLLSKINRVFPKEIAPKHDSFTKLTSILALIESPDEIRLDDLSTLLTTLADVFDIDDTRQFVSCNNSLTNSLRVHLITLLDG